MDTIVRRLKIENSHIKILMFILLLNITFLFLGPTIQKYIFSDVSFLPWLVLVMFLDLITGILKTVHIYGWGGVTSYGIRRTVSKVIQYSVFLILLNLLVKFEIGGEVVLKELVWVVKIGQQFLIFIEAKSIKENLDVVNPKFLSFKHLTTKLFPFLHKEEKDEDIEKED